MKIITEDYFKKFTAVFIACLIFLPKISLIDLLHYRQGIRLEDIFALTYGFFLIGIFRSKLPIKFHLLWGIFFYLIFVNIIASILEIEIEWIINFRILEYIVFGYVIYFALHFKQLKSGLLLAYIYLNTILALLQYFHLVGAFASFGYLESTHGWLERPYGITGGPWELGATTILANICYQKQKGSNHLFWANVCTLLCVILAGTRANIVAFVFIFLVTSYEHLKFKFLFYLFLPLICLPLFEAHLPSTLSRIEAIYNIPFFEIFNANLDIVKIIKILGVDPSLEERFRVWTNSYNLWTANWITFIFGIGWHNLYMESFIFRILFSFGIVGFVFLLYCLYFLEISLIIFLLFCGLTLDLFVSSKIFCFFTISLLWNRKL
jgi:hypothetical protein